MVKGVKWLTLKLSRLSSNGPTKVDYVASDVATDASIMFGLFKSVIARFTLKRVMSQLGFLSS